MFIILFFILFICFRFPVSKSFEYKTNRFDVREDVSTSYHRLENNEEIIQYFQGRDALIKGITLRFGTYAKVNSGNLLVQLFDDHSLIHEWSLNTEQLKDNADQEFRLKRAFWMSAQNTYKIVIKETYEGDNAIALWTSENGNGLYSGNNSLWDKTACFRLIICDEVSIQKVALPTLLLLSVIFIFIFINFDFRGSVKGYAISFGLFLLLAESLAIDLFPYINSNVVMEDFRPTEMVSITVEPRETLDAIHRVETPVCSIFAISLPSDLEHTENIHLTLVNEDTGVVYVNRQVAAWEIISEGPTGKAICIDTRFSPLEYGNFSLGNYRISLTNMSQNENLRLSLIENSDGTLYYNIGLRKTTWIGYFLAIMILLICLSYILFILVYRQRHTIGAESFFLISAIPLSIIFLILFPHWSSPDSEAHVRAAYRISNLFLGHGGNEQWFARGDDKYYIETFVRGDNPYMRDYLKTIYHFKFFESSPSLADLNVHEEKMTFYSALNYLPQAIGICIGRLLHLGSVTTFYLGRLGILVVYLFSCLRAIRNTPVGKYIFALIPLFPMALMMSSSYSYDAMVIVSSLSLTACILKLSMEPTNKICMMEILLWTFIVGGIKGGGSLILLPLLAIVYLRSKPEEKKKVLKALLLIFALGLCSLILFDIILPNGLGFQFGNGGTGKMTTSYLFFHPLIYFDMLLKTYIDYLTHFVFQLGGTHLGWLEYTIPHLYIMGIFIVTCILALCETDGMQLSRYEKRIMGAIIVLEMILLPAMLLSYTPHQSVRVEGIQGRYFFPIIPLVFLLMTKKDNHVLSHYRNQDQKQMMINKSMLCFAFLLVASVYYMLKLYLSR